MRRLTEPLIRPIPPPDYRRRRTLRMKVLSWSIWALASCFVLFQFFLQLSSGLLIGNLMQSFHLNALGASLFASTYYYIYVLLQTPAGLLMDRIGPRILLSGGAFICGIGGVLFSMSTILGFAVFGRILMGFGASFAFVGLIYLSARWFPIERFSLMVGVAEMLGMCGSIIGSLFLAKLIHSVGWRQCMLAAALFSFLLAIWLGIVVRDRQVRKHRSQMLENFREHLFKLFKNKQAWLNGIYVGFMFSVVTVFVALWGIPFLENVYHYPTFKATLACDMVFFGAAVGSPVVGWFDQRLKNRRLFMCMGALVTTLILSVIIYFNSLNDVLVFGLLFFLGIFCSIYVLCFIIADEIVLPKLRATSIGFANTLAVGTAPIFQPIVGALLHHQASQSHFVLHAFSDNQFRYALFILPVLTLIAAGVALLLQQSSRVRRFE